MKGRAIRLKDVAEASGVSVSAVSLILRGLKEDRFSDDTQKRVRAAAEKLGWRPNLLVSGLQTGTSLTAGVFIAPFDPYWSEVLSGIHDALLARQYVPLVLWPEGPIHPRLDQDGDPAPGATGSGSARGAAGGRDEVDRLLRLVDRRVDGILTWPLFEPEAREELARLSNRGWPVCLIDDALDDAPDAATLGTDEEAAAGLVVEHLRELGHTQIAYANVDRTHAWAVRRREAVLSLGVPHTCTVADARSGARDRIAGFLQARPEVTAFVAASDRLALQVLAAARDAGRPELSVVGYGNVAFDTSAAPLTSVEQNPREIGRVAVEATLKRGKGPRGDHRVAPKLVVRGSTRPAQG